MDEDMENLWADEIADFINENLFAELMGPNGEKPVLMNEHGDPLFPQTEDNFPIQEVPGAHEVIRQKMNPIFRKSGWLWN